MARSGKITGPPPLRRSAVISSSVMPGSFSDFNRATPNYMTSSRLHALPIHAVQQLSRSRARLREAYSSAAAEQRNHTMEEIIKMQIPCLDAMIEEANRTAQIFYGSIRTTTVDMAQLGHSTPPRAPTSSPCNSVRATLWPPLPVDDATRSRSKNQTRTVRNTYDAQAEPPDVGRPGSARLLLEAIGISAAAQHVGHDDREL
ncbi:hypothetical protein AYO20_06931 [Fonsecaea nubica]|uniref:Uncharacterized protein n=1 Tax=Fonsecaea nubica TaxID=856822 RepID=A0A178CY01_9EURO|nr:hypothetical protein AYO20_06931 [Fonsecaea nubica]OAL33755.1 hypothetical protein AYO20_06931 [Fonsecaea nubica]